MPYVDQDRRLTSEQEKDLPIPQTTEELAYAFTKLSIRYATQHDLSYQTINDIVGALEGAKAEFVRRVVVPYEEKKLAENGDVYPRWML